MQFYLVKVAVLIAGIATAAEGKANGINIHHSKVLSIRGGGGDTGSGALEEINPFDWRFFVAGGVCAAASHGITTPIDVVKTRMQTDPEKYNKGVLHAAKEIVREEGIGFLLAGLGPTVAGYGFEGALKFGFYEAFKPIFGSLTPLAFVNKLLASVVAGAIAAIVLCPMEEARIKMVGQASWANENTISAIARLIREDGLFSSFGGLPAMTAKQVPYTMGKQVSYDVVTKFLYRMITEANLSPTDLKWGISVLSAFFASIAACLTSQPGDMILTASYKGDAKDGSAGDKSFVGAVSKIYREHGLGGFYLGLQARLMHVASIITTQLVIYDIVKTALGLPATGSH